MTRGVAPRIGKLTSSISKFTFWICNITYSICNHPSRDCALHSGVVAVLLGDAASVTALLVSDRRRLPCHRSTPSDSTVHTKNYGIALEKYAQFRTSDQNAVHSRTPPRTADIAFQVIRIGPYSRPQSVACHKVTPL